MKLSDLTLQELQSGIWLFRNTASMESAVKERLKVEYPEISEITVDLRWIDNFDDEMGLNPFFWLPPELDEMADLNEMIMEEHDKDKY